MNQLLKMNSAWCYQRLLVMTLALVLAQTGAHAEIGRVSLTAVLEEVLTREGAFDAFEEVSFPAKELASRVPEMVRVVLSEDAKVEGDAPPEGVDRSLVVRPVYVIVDREGIVREVRAGVVKTVGPSAGTEVSDGIPEHHLEVRLQPRLQRQ